MLGNLRMKMPQTNLKATVMKDAAPRHKPAVSKKKKISKSASIKEEKAPPKKEMTELDKLQSELNAIESKLKNLT